MNNSSNLSIPSEANSENSENVTVAICEVTGKPNMNHNKNENSRSAEGRLEKSVQKKEYSEMEKEQVDVDKHFSDSFCLNDFTSEVNVDFNMTEKSNLKFKSFSPNSNDINKEFFNEADVYFQNQIQVDSENYIAEEDTTKTILSDFHSFDLSNCAFETGLEDAAESKHVNEHLKDTSISPPTNNKINEFFIDIDIFDNNAYDAEIYQSVTGENTSCNRLHCNLSSKNKEDNKLLNSDTSTQRSYENINDAFEGLEASNQTKENFECLTSSQDLNQEKGELLSHSNEQFQIKHDIHLGMSFEELFISPLTTRINDFLEERLDKTVESVSLKNKGKEMKTSESGPLNLDTLSYFNGGLEYLVSEIYSQQRNNNYSPQFSPSSNSNRPLNSDVSNFDDLIKFNNESKSSGKGGEASSSFNYEENIKSNRNQNQNQFAFHFENSLDEIFKSPPNEYRDEWNEYASVNYVDNCLLNSNSSQHSNQNYENHVTDATTALNQKNKEICENLSYDPDFYFENQHDCDSIKYLAKLSQSLIHFNSAHSENLDCNLQPYSPYDDVHDTTSDLTNVDEFWKITNHVISQRTAGTETSFEEIHVANSEYETALEILHSKNYKPSLNTLCHFESMNSDESFKSSKQIMEENADMNVDIYSSENENTALEIITLYKDDQPEFQNEKITETEYSISSMHTEEMNHECKVTSKIPHDKIEKPLSGTKLIFNCHSADKLSGCSTTVISDPPTESMAIIVPDFPPHYNGTTANNYSLHLDKFNIPYHKTGEGTIILKLNKTNISESESCKSPYLQNESPSDSASLVHITRSPGSLDQEKNISYVKDSSSISQSEISGNGTLNFDELRYFCQNPEIEPENSINMLNKFHTEQILARTFQKSPSFNSTDEENFQFDSGKRKTSTPANLRKKKKRKRVQEVSVEGNSSVLRKSKPFSSPKPSCRMKSNSLQSENTDRQEIFLTSNLETKTNNEADAIISKFRQIAPKQNDSMWEEIFSIHSDSMDDKVVGPSKKSSEIIPELKKTIWVPPSQNELHEVIKGDSVKGQTLSFQHVYYDEIEDSINTNDVTQSETETAKLSMKNLPLINKKEGKFLCPICQRRLAGKLSSVLHQCICKVKPYICVYCEKRYGSKYLLKNHLIEHIGDVGDEVESEQENEVENRNEHTKQNDFDEEINSISSTDSAKENDKYQKSKINESKCASLSKDLDKMDKNSDCTHGGKTDRKTVASSAKETLASPKSSEHVTNVHQNSLEKTQFKCNECLKAYQFKSQLRQHVLRHNPNSYICNFCPKSYKSFRNLKRHCIVHGLALTSPYICKKCGFLAKSNKDLTFHMEKHKIQNVARCSYCKYLCKCTRDLRKHVIRKHTRKFKYTCTFCHKGFITPKELKMHLERIHNEKGGNKDF